MRDVTDGSAGFTFGRIFASFVYSRRMTWCILNGDMRKRNVGHSDRNEWRRKRADDDGSDGRGIKFLQRSATQKFFLRFHKLHNFGQMRRQESQPFINFEVSMSVPYLLS